MTTDYYNTLTALGVKSCDVQCGSCGFEPCRLLSYLIHSYCLLFITIIVVFRYVISVIICYRYMYFL